MFVGFNLSSLAMTPECENYYYDKGEKLFTKETKEDFSHLGSYIIKTDTLSADLISKDWFPQVNAQIFLSHSHRDQHIVTAFAGWLKKEIGVDAFIDSWAWGYCDDLIQKMQHTYIKTPNAFIRSHVYMILSTALAKMIDRTECFIFINTQQSINIKDIVTNGTSSSWIYHELLMSNLIRHKSLECHAGRPKPLQESLQISYNVNDYINSLHNLTVKDIEDWKDIVEDSKKCLPFYNDFTATDAMDILYEMKKVPR